jgi:hypothetical protein
MLKFFGGMIILALGAFMAVKSESFHKAFGPIAWFEQHLGTEGGSRLGYKLIGVLVFFLGFMIMTGMINGFMMWILGPLMINRGV